MDTRGETPGPPGEMSFQLRSSSPPRPWARPLRNLPRETPSRAGPPRTSHSHANYGPTCCVTHWSSLTSLVPRVVLGSGMAAQTSQHLLLNISYSLNSSQPVMPRSAGLNV